MRKPREGDVDWGGLERSREAPTGPLWRNAMAPAGQKIPLSSTRDIPTNWCSAGRRPAKSKRASRSRIVSRYCSPQPSHQPQRSVELDSEGNETAIYRTPAGWRRYRALERLMAQKRLAKGADVSCIVSRGETLEIKDPLTEKCSARKLASTRPVSSLPDPAQARSG